MRSARRRRINTLATVRCHTTRAARPPRFGPTPGVLSKFSRLWISLGDESGAVIDGEGTLVGLVRSDQETRKNCDTIPISSHKCEIHTLTIVSSPDSLPKKHVPMGNQISTTASQDPSAGFGRPFASSPILNRITPSARS